MAMQIPIGGGTVPVDPASSINDPSYNATTGMLS
jgi:hypothetical protein